MLLSPLVSQDFVPMMASINQADLLFIKELMETGKVTPVIDRAYPLAEVPEAIRFLEQGRARGKVIILVSDDE